MRGAAPGEPVDLDRLVEVTLTVGGVAGYFAGSTYGAVLLGLNVAGWVGAFSLAAWSVPPVIYALVKSQQRRTTRQDQAKYAGRQEGFAGSGAGDGRGHG